MNEAPWQETLDGYLARTAANANNEGNLRKSEWRVGREEHALCVPVVEAHHYSHSAANTSIYAHSLRKATGGGECDLYGAALWMPQLKTAAVATARQATELAGYAFGFRQVLHLSRLVVLPGVPTCGASFLLGRSMRLIDRKRFPVLVTYADDAFGHKGTIYKATNWHYIGSFKSDPIWQHETTGEIRGRHRGKFCFTYAEMRAQGFAKREGTIKHKFIHVR